MKYDVICWENADRCGLSIQRVDAKSPVQAASKAMMWWLDALHDNQITIHKRPDTHGSCTLSLSSANGLDEPTEYSYRDLAEICKQRKTAAPTLIIKAVYAENLLPKKYRPK